jgi:iron complex outermembrane recepter protein
MKLPALALAACAVLPCSAAEDAPAPSRFETVVVTGTRSPQGENHLPAAISVITREAIERSGARHVADVLRLAGAAQVTDLFGDGSRATVDLRGFGEGAHSTTLVLVDGRRLNNTDIAAPDLNSISLKDVERIEIIQGSAGTLYGDQAVGGVVNIVTREPQRFRVTGEAGAGSYGGLAARAAVEQRWTSASARLSAETRGTDNYRAHNALEYRNVLGRVGVDEATRGLFVEAGYVDEDLETPGALSAAELAADRRQASPNFRGDFADTNTGFVRVNLHQAFGDAWRGEMDMDHRRANGAFRLSSVFGPSTSNSSQDRDVRAMRPRLTGSVPTPCGDALFTAGLDAQIADYRLESPFGVQSNKQHQGDVYGQAIVPLRRGLEATVGARYASVRNEVQDGFTFPAPTEFSDRRWAEELGLAWYAARDVRLFARYDRNFRFAKVDEFTNAGAPFGSGIVNLRTQTGGSYEAGGEWAPGQVRLRIAAYRLNLSDEIAFDPATFTNVNLERTRRDGVIAEASGAWRALTVSLAGHHVNSQVRGAGLDGRSVPLVARNTGKLAAAISLPVRLTGRVEILATGKRALAGDFDNSQPDLPGYALTNAGLGWGNGSLSLDARVNNVLDREYSEYGVATGFPEEPAYYPSPERNFWVTARYDW